MRRFVSIWLPHWPTDRWRRRQRNADPRPLALLQAVQGGVRLAALDANAAALGLAPGMPFADARALVPDLLTATADPDGEQRDLAALADWCSRFSPWVAADGEDGLLLDISGLSHLFGGEAALLQEIAARFGALALSSRLAAAGTPAAAWAWARYGEGGALAASAAARLLEKLPSASLRLPAEMIADFDRLGLRKVGDLRRLPRAPLAHRFGLLPVRRIALMFGEAEQPITPRHPPAERRSRIAFAEPIGRAEDIALALRRLLAELCRLVEAEHLGIRRLELICYRADGGSVRIGIGAGRPSRDVAHFARLFQEKIGEIDPGFGIDAMVLEAAECNPLSPTQEGLDEAAGSARDVNALLDRLRNRLGAAQVLQFLPRDTHWPDRVVRLQSAPAASKGGHADWAFEQSRPLCLLPSPELLEVEDAARSDLEPPRAFRWRRARHRVRQAEGPERIAPEWWRQGAAQRSRDYFRLEDEDGRRFWIYRDGTQWYLHGLFA